MKRSHKRAAKYGDVDLMNSLIDSELYGNAFYERLRTLVEMYKEDPHPIDHSLLLYSSCYCVSWVEVQKQLECICDMNVMYMRVSE